MPSSGVIGRSGDPAPPAIPPAAGATAPAATTGLIVDDGVSDLRPEQLHRTDFVSQAGAAARQGAGSAAGPVADRVEPQVNDLVARCAGKAAAQLEARARSLGTLMAGQLRRRTRRAPTRHARRRFRACSGRRASHGRTAGCCPRGADASGPCARGVDGTVGLMCERRTGAMTPSRRRLNMTGGARLSAREGQ